MVNSNDIDADSTLVLLPRKYSSKDAHNRQVQSPTMTQMLGYSTYCEEVC